MKELPAISKESRKKIRQALRRLWIFSEERREALRRAHAGRGMYICEACRYIRGKKEVQVDHIHPVGGDGCYNTHISLLFCPADNLQVLCKSCHKLKTKKDLSDMKRDLP